MNTISLIKQCPLFSELNAQALKALVEVSQRSSCDKEGVLFHEGEEANSLYILINGSVDLIKSTLEGRQQLVRSVKGGEMFAEAAMFAGETYPVTAITRTRSEYIVITKNRFVKLVKSHPEISMTIIGTMAKLLRHLNKRLSDLSLESVASRLAKFLLKKSREVSDRSFSLGMSKRDLAFKLGTIPETLSRNLKKMKDGGIIEISKDKIILKDINMLESLT